MNKQQKGFAGWASLAVLSLLPAGLWAWQAPLKEEFSNFPDGVWALGDLAGLCGMAMFALMIILSSRAKFLDKFFNGINQSYVFHHVFGGLAFSLLLFHPLLLSYRFVSFSFASGAEFFLSAESWPVNFGKIALFVMAIALIITFYMKIKYQIWKFTHKFLGIAFIIASLHAFLIGADVSSNLPLKLYLFALSAGAIAAYFYRTIFGNYLVKIYEYKVENVLALADKTTEITMKPVKNELKFAPGQFVFIKFLSQKLSAEPHPFTISSATGNPLRLAIKDSGDYTKDVGKLVAGDRAYIEGPFGAFSLKKINNKKQIWIAGGIGITPFLSMARSFDGTEKDYDINFYYSTRNEQSLVFKEEIEKIAAAHNNFNIVMWPTDKNGFLTAEKIKAKITNIAEYDVLICGPKPMMDALQAQFLQLSPPKNQIHTEEFALY